MKQYMEYQPTEYDWLPQVPAHWKPVTIRSITCISDERNSQRMGSELLSVYREYGVIKKSSRDDNRNVESQDLSNYKYVRPGYLVMNKMKMWQGSLGVSKYEGIVSPAYIVCKLTVDANNDYIHMLLRSPLFKTFYNRISYGVRVGQWDMNYDDFKQLRVFLPSKDEQNHIVHYLDWQTSRINKLINAKKKQIALLEEQKQVYITDVVTKGLNPSVQMKDSGIDYIGVVPAHWKVLLNHRIYKENSRKFEGDELVLSLSQKDGLLPYKDMKERSLHTASYDNWKLVMPNDLVLNRFKAHLGVFFSSNYRGIVTFHYGVYEPVMELSSKFYEALYHTAEFKRIFASRSNGMTVGLQNLSNTNFYSVYTVYPPYDEQCEIVKEVERIEEKYRVLIEKIGEEINCLHEYRTRLISDVVTGQVDVRDVVIPEYEAVQELAEEEDDTFADETEMEEE